MLGLFDPTMEPDVEPPSDLLKLIPMYRSPKVQAGILPGKNRHVYVGLFTVALRYRLEFY